MIALAIGLSALFGVGLGMGLGRFFCKWHHKDDEVSCCDEGRCQTIGEEIEGCKTPETWVDGSKHPGCGPGGCCKDE